MALNKVELCGVNTAKLPTLTQEEKDALFIRIKRTVYQRQSAARTKCDQTFWRKQ